MRQPEYRVMWEESPQAERKIVRQERRGTARLSAQSTP